MHLLAQAPADDVAKLPWPSQDHIAHRKSQLKEALGELFATAHLAGNNDVEVLLKSNPELRAKVRSCLVTDSSFIDAVRSWGAWFQGVHEAASDAGGDASGAKRQRVAENSWQ